jgi:hypothetical protein
VTVAAALLGNGPALYPNFDAATWYELVIWGVCASAGMVTAGWLSRNYNHPEKDRAAGIGCLALVVFAVGGFVAANAGQVRKMRADLDRTRALHEAEERRGEELEKSR